jgi:hypothetical protein
MGKKIHLWFDFWHPAGRLFEDYGHRLILEARSNLEAPLSIVIQDRQLRWWPARLEYMVEIQSKLSLIQMGREDKLVWNISKSG